MTAPDDATAIYGEDATAARVWLIDQPDRGVASVEAYAGHLGRLPADLFGGTPAELCVYLRANGYDQLATDHGALAYIWEGQQP